MSDPPPPPYTSPTHTPPPPPSGTPQPGQAQPPFAAAPGGQQQTAGKATGALVLSIASFVVCPVIAAIVSLVLAAQAKREIAASYGRLGGEGLVTASRVLSIINLCLSLLMVPLLFAIAIPTFMAAQDRAQEQAVQSDLDSALAAELSHYSQAQQWTDDPVTLSTLEPTLLFERAATPSRSGVVYVTVEGEALGLATMTDEGECYYVMSDPQEGTLYAEDPDCGPVQEQNYVEARE